MSAILHLPSFIKKSLESKLIMKENCGCKPGNAANGWHETRSVDCALRERKAFAKAIESFVEIVKSKR